MKTNAWCLVLFTTMIIVTSCQDVKDDATSSADITYYENVGIEIPLETGKRWIRTFENDVKANGRTSFADFSLSALQLYALRNGVSNFTGIAFHYAIDETGGTRMIAIPVDETLKLWTEVDGRQYLDLTSGLFITQATASQWTQTFKDANPNGIWFHYFGRNVFDEIALIPYFTQIDVEPAINDGDGSPQLLLMIWDFGLNTGAGRKNAEDGKSYDASNPCPPCRVG